jgi:HNH endonuclease
MSKEEIIAAIQESTARLGHVPSVTELERLTKLGKRDIRRCFSNYKAALEACGLERQGIGYEVELKTLFLDWAAIVRKLGKVPTMTEYELGSSYSVRPLVRRYGAWGNVAAGMVGYARNEGLETEWNDVVDIGASQMESVAEPGRTLMRTQGATLRPRFLKDQPTYGPPLLHMPLCLAPTNELGVVFLFGTVARELGFMVLRLQAEFPDCEALREVEPGRWQWVRIEFEYESRNFLAHQHPVKGCDLIVCWRHNWKDCPLEVIELSQVIGKEPFAADLRR